MQRKNISRVLAVAAMSAIPTVLSLTGSAQAQTWGGATGSWALGTNWVGGAAPVSGAGTNLLFQDVGYTSTNDIGPFTLGQMLFGNTGTANVAGGALAFSGTGNILGQTGSGTANITASMTGTGFKMQSGNGTVIMNAGSILLTSAASVGVSSDLVGIDATNNNPDHSFSIGNVAGQTAAFVMNGGTLIFGDGVANGGNGYVGDNGTGIAIFQNGANVRFNTQTSEATGGVGGRFGTNVGTGSIQVLSGAIVHCRLFELGRNTGTGTFVKVDGAGSRIEANQLLGTRLNAGNVGIVVSNGGELNVDLNTFTNSNGSLQVGVGAGFILNNDDSATPGNAASTLTINSGGKVHNNGNFTAGSTAIASFSDNTIAIDVSGAGSRLDVVPTANIIGNTATHTPGVFTTAFGGQMLLGFSFDTSPVTRTVSTLSINSGAAVTSRTFFASLADDDLTTINVNNSTWTVGSAPFVVDSAAILSGGGGEPGGVTNVNVSNGGVFTVVDLLNVGQDGEATVIVDGATSQLNVIDTDGGVGTVSVGQLGLGTGTNGAATSGILTLQNGSTGAVGGSVFVAPNVGNTGVLNVTNATLTVGGQLQIGGSGGLDGGAGTATFGSTVLVTDLTNVYTPGTMHQNAGTFTSGAMTVGGRVNYNGGIMSVATLTVANGSINISGSGKALRATSVTTTGTGKIDLGNNGLIVDYTGASPIEAIRTQIITGRNGGDWLGNGITSSVAATNAATPAVNDDTFVGYAEAGVLGISSFQGQGVDADTVVARHVLGGDADLNGSVNGADLNILLSSFGRNNGLGLQRWRGDSTNQKGGDFNYDTETNGADFNILAARFGTSMAGAGDGSGTIPTAIFPGFGLGTGTVPLAMVDKGMQAYLPEELLRGGGTGPGASVPEPTALTVLGLGAMGLMARRRRA